MRWLILFWVLCVSCFGCAQRKAPPSGIDSARASIPDSSRLLVYPWKGPYKVEDKLMNRIQVPDGFERVPVGPGSFAEWLRHLPLKPGRPDVVLHNGNLKQNQRVHHAVVDIDVGTADLQQCADAVMRLRAEYLYSKASFGEISFNYTSGFPCDFSTWSQGFRPKVTGNKVEWQKRADASSSYDVFRAYLTSVFTYAGTYSLEKSMKPKLKADITGGDVFIQGGFPGHAVLVADVAVNKNTGERIFLLVQSYMPAQDIHVLRNFTDDALSPWFSNRFIDDLDTPEWTFPAHSLKAF